MLSGPVEYGHVTLHLPPATRPGGPGTRRSKRKTHVAQILRKLNLRGRVRAVDFAYEIGLVELEPGTG
ncbi:MAG: hypothetical protein ACXVRK_01040 [Gaiellaceae bacterium]